MKLQSKAREPDDTNMISLINIVFLILIFFLIASIIRPFSAKDIELVKSLSKDKYTRHAQTLVIDKTGNLIINGTPTDPQDLLTMLGKGMVITEGEQGEARLNIIADQSLPSGILLDHLKTIQSLKFASIQLVTERKKQ